MGNLMDKIKTVIGATDEDYYDDDMQSDDFINYSSDSYDDEKTVSQSAFRHKLVESDKIMKIPTTASVQVVLVKPERFDDARSIADHLNNKHTVVLNLESANKDVARRLVDFLSGVAYANGGQIKRVANSTFIITPYNVDITGDLIGEIESNGVLFFE